jgi:hypothetical protein
MSWLSAQRTDVGLQYRFEENPRLHRLQLTGVGHVADGRYHRIGLLKFVAK